jgi:hypothetical protein
MFPASATRNDGDQARLTRRSSSEPFPYKPIKYALTARSKRLKNTRPVSSDPYFLMLSFIYGATILIAGLLGAPFWILLRKQQSLKS